jgi:hypothetical protein
MRRALLAMLGAAVLTAGLVTGPASHAVWVRPAAAPLVDAAGADSGCDLELGPARAVVGATEGPYAGSPGHLEAQATLSCPRHWRAVSISDRWQVVRADGTRGELFWGGNVMSWWPDDTVPPAEPYVGGSVLNVSPCMLRTDGQMHLPGTDLKWLLPLGRHDFLLGTMAKVNEYKAGGHPYRAVVERLVPVRCTTARAAYR